MSFSLTYSGLSVWSNFNLSHNSCCITFPAQSCILLCFFCASFLHMLKSLSEVSCKLAWLYSNVYEIEKRVYYFGFDPCVFGVYVVFFFFRFFCD